MTDTRVFVNANVMSSSSFLQSYGECIVTKDPISECLNLVAKGRTTSRGRPLLSTNVEAVIHAPHAVHITFFVVCLCANQLIMMTGDAFNVFLMTAQFQKGITLG